MLISKNQICPNIPAVAREITYTIGHLENIVASNGHKIISYQAGLDI